MLLTARLPVNVSSVQTWFYICKEIFARKHTATQKPTSARPLIVITMTPPPPHTHTNTHTHTHTRALVGVEPCRCPVLETNEGTETTFRHGNQAYTKSKRLEVRGQLMRSKSRTIFNYIDLHAQRLGFRPKRNHFRRQRSYRATFGHTGWWPIAKCSRKPRWNYTGRFRR